MANLRILFIGATGYIGGSVLTRLLTHPRRSHFDIAILLRTASKAGYFETFGLNVIVGSLDHLELVEFLAHGADVVFQCANADHFLSMKAILKGLNLRYQNTKIPTVLIHTSCADTFRDAANGDFAGEVTYSDLDASTIEAIPLNRPHRQVDAAIVAADQKGFVKTYIILPSTVWGVATNSFTQQNLQNRASKIVPSLIAFGLERGAAAICGKGLNVWSHINIEEMGEFYYVLFDRVISGDEPPHGREGYYILENGEFVYGDLCRGIAQVLHAFGKLRTTRVVPLTGEEKAEYPYTDLVGSNCRTRGERARSIGWYPMQKTDDFLGNLQRETGHWLRANPEY